MSIANSVSRLWQNRKAILYYGCVSVMWILFVAIVLQKGALIFLNGTPQEIREMNTVVFADYFAHGKNLYAVSNLESAIPAPTSMYGFLVPLILAFFVRLFSFTGLSSLQICELITLAVEITGALFFYRLFYRKTSQRLTAVVGMVFFYYCYWRYDGFGGAFPDQWGITLSIILLYLVDRDTDRNAYRPGLYAAFIIGLFYIKQYFVFAVIGLCVYLFIRSKKEFTKLILYGIGEGFFSVLLVYCVFPLYFSEALPIGQGQTNTSDMAHSIGQIRVLNEVYKGAIVFGCVYFFMLLYQKINRKKWRGGGKILYEFCQLVCILPLTVYIAQNGGTTYTYYLQLWYPYVAACCTVAMGAVIDAVKARQSIRIRIVCYALCCLSVLFSLYQMLRAVPFFKCYFMTEQERAAWDRSYQILEEYAQKGDILVPMLLSDYCLKNDMETSDYGQAQYNSPKNLENYKQNDLWQHLFLVRYTEAVLEKNIHYNNVIIKQALANQEYSCIALTSAEDYWLTQEEVTGAGYVILQTEKLISGRTCWDVTFYVKEE